MSRDRSFTMGTPRSRARQWRRLAARVTWPVVAAAFALPSHAGAASPNWQIATPAGKLPTPNGNWSDTAHWSTGTVPANGDFVTIALGGTSTDTVTYDVSGNGITLNSLLIDLNAGTGGFHQMMLNINAGSLVVTTETIGSTVGGGTHGNGAINLSGGFNGTTFLVMGFNATDVGNYSLSGSAVLTAFTETLGLSGSANFNQSGGNNSLTSGSSNLYLGYGAASSGTYNLSGGNLITTAGGNELVGYNGNGLLNITGGLDLLTGIGSISVGFNAGSTGTVSLSGGGAINVSGSGSEDIGFQGSGTFIHTGNTNTISGAAGGFLRLGAINNANGYYSLGGTGTLNVASGTGVAEYVGYAGNGTFVQDGGLNSISAGILYVANSSGSTGSYTLSGGTLSVNIQEDIGVSGSATFIQTGGTNVVVATTSFAVTPPIASLVLGRNAGATGTYSLSGTGILALSGYAYIGAGGTGSFVQSGSSFAPAAIFFGYSAGGTGSYVLNSGTFQPSYEDIGEFGFGTFIQAGGTHTVNSNLFLGVQSFSNGTYLLNAGTLSVGGPGSTIIGYDGNGTFIQTGGENQSAPGPTPMIIGQSGTGIYSLSGTGQMDQNNEVIGDQGSGVFIQSAGTHNVTGNVTVSSTTVNNSSVILGQSLGSSGSYSLTGGALTVGGSESVGVNGAGSFTQSAGTNTVPILTVGGEDAGSIVFTTTSGTGAYSLGGTGVLTVTGGESIGAGGNGSFIQTGGTHTVPYLTVGAGQYIGGGTFLNTAGPGFYSLGGTGVLAVTSGEFIGGAGGATFVQTGGSNTVGGPFDMPFFPGSITSYYLLSGPSTLTVSGDENMGSGGPGSFSQSGGINTIGGSLKFFSANALYDISAGAANVASNVQINSGTLNVSGTGALAIAGTLMASNSLAAAINLSGGSITTFALNFAGRPAVLNWTGGTLHITTGVIFDSAAANTTTSAAFGSALTLNANQTFILTGNETLGGVGAFTLTLNNGAAHNVSGTLTLVPNGTLNLNTGGTLSYGAFVLAGGTIGGSGNFINANTFTGFGTITGSGTFTNFGNLAPTAAVTFSRSGGLFNEPGAAVNLANSFPFMLSTAAITNDGALNINGGSITGTGNINEQIINNGDGIIAGPGVIAVPITNNGAIMLASGSFVLPALTNPGLIAISAGTVSSPLLNNTGVIALSGDAANLTSAAPILNPGILQGYGKVSAAVTNSGTIESIGGTLAFNAPLTNNATLRVDSGSKFLALSAAAFPANAGLISMLGGTLDMNNHTLANNGTIAGFGTITTGGLTNNGQIQFASGGSQVYGAVASGAGAKITVTSAATATFFGPVALASSTFQVSPGGTAVFFGAVTGTNNFAGTGTIDFEASHSAFAGGILTPAAVQVQPGATVDLTALQVSSLYLGGNVNVLANGTNGGLSVLGALTNAGGKMDLGNNDLIVRNALLTAVLPMVASAYAGGAWSGPGITSSAAVGNAGQGLAVVTGASYLLLNPAGLFDGATVGASDVLVKYTYQGDATLDGRITVADYAQIDAAFLLRVSGPTWFNGDFNYDGVVDYKDYALIDFAFQHQTGGVLAEGMVEKHGAEFGEPYLEALAAAGSGGSVPEPGSLGLLAMGTVGLMRISVKSRAVDGRQRSPRDSIPGLGQARE